MIYRKTLIFGLMLLTSFGAVAQVPQTGHVIVDSSGVALPSVRVSGCANTTGTGDVSVVAASGSATLKTYIVACQVINSGSAGTVITFKDGSGGSTLGTTGAAASYGGSNPLYPIPLVTTANTAFYFAAASASTTVYVCCQGYKAQ